MVRAGVSKAEFEAPCSKSSTFKKTTLQWSSRAGRDQRARVPTGLQVSLAPAFTVGSQIALPPHFLYTHKIKTYILSQASPIFIPLLFPDLNPINMH